MSSYRFPMISGWSLTQTSCTSSRASWNAWSRHWAGAAGTQWRRRELWRGARNENEVAGFVEGADFFPWLVPTNIVTSSKICWLNEVERFDDWKTKNWFWWFDGFQFFCFSFAATSQQVNDRTWSTSMLMLARFPTCSGQLVYSSTGLMMVFLRSKKDVHARWFKSRPFHLLVEGHQQHHFDFGSCF